MSIDGVQFVWPKVDEKQSIGITKAQLATDKKKSQDISYSYSIRTHVCTCILGCRDFDKLISAGPHIVANVNMKQICKYWWNYLIISLQKVDLLNYLDCSSKIGK
jgi:hypothetical protein